MNIILGFGATEEQQRQKVKDDLKNIFNKVCKTEYGFITQESRKEFEIEFEKYQEEISDEYEKYEALPINQRPERYYNIKYGHRIAFTYDTVFVLLKFWHINSKHPLSPDGMALMEVFESFYFQKE